MWKAPAVVAGQGRNRTGKPHGAQPPAHACSFSPGSWRAGPRQRPGAKTKWNGGERGLRAYPPSPVLPGLRHREATLACLLLSSSGTYGGAQRALTPPRGFFGDRVVPGQADQAAEVAVRSPTESH